MNLNIVNDETHRVNDEVKYEVSRVESHPVIIIDDVLENPHDFISEVVEKLPMQYNDLDSRGEPDEVFPGYQSRLFIELPELSKLIFHMIEKCTEFENIDTNYAKVSYQVNSMFSDRQVPRVSVQPHIDPAVYATVLYLNDGQGGTSFFKHKATGLTNTENIHKPFKRTEEYWNLKEWFYDFSDKATDMIDNDTMLIEDVWEEEYHVPMKFNRLIIYPSYMWHSAIMKKGWYKDTPRTSLSGFIFADSLNVDINAE
jgi:hypothetical protein|tara:strand:+ start:30142 stop:30909 length:768 start_codon:yes stop_codon:yes gene_type:complete